MHRFSLTLAAMALLAMSLTGCCCSHLCGGGGGYGGACYPPPASPCGPCGQTYGATYGAPTVGAPNCPNGNCGMYPSGAFYGPSAPVAAAGPAMYTTAALPMNTLPTY